MNTFTKGFLTDLLGNPRDAVVADEPISMNRWTEVRQLVFAFEGELWAVHYEVGLTEDQDVEPFEYDPEDVEAWRVEPYQETVIKYRKVNHGDA